VGGSCQDQAAAILEFLVMLETLPTALERLTFRPVTRLTLPDLERFSECHGKFRYCSCMRWRLRSSDYKRTSKDQRVAMLAELAQDNAPVGVLAYLGEEPVGWCAIAPRGHYAALERFGALPRVDDQAVWSVVCFFIDRQMRRQGVALGLLKAAVAYAASQGAKIVEGYPVEPGPRLYTYMGAPDTFRRAGFRDVTPEGAPRLIVRRVIKR
jgi:GNAT superfamily N-acetyltransferase